MDPFSITASIVTLIQVSAQVTVLVRQFRDEVSVVDATLNGILNDVDGFQQVLQSMKETFAQEDLRADVQTTGHVGSHWKNLARSLSDGESTLDQLRSLLTSVSKSTSFLDAPRKQLRLKSAITQIAGFREQIQSYRAALQLSLSTVVVWNQVTLRKATDKIPDRILPNLNKLYEEIRSLGTSLNAKIVKLENTVENQGFNAESELLSMTNLKECVESAADVVSTASTTLGPEGSERASVKYGSDFGDVFKKNSNPTMQRWISSNTVYEFEDVEAPTLDPSETSTGDAFTEYQSDSDSDIENELVRALFSNGKKRKEQGDLHGAERHLRNCLSRFPTTSSYTSLTSSQSTSVTGVSKAELLELLTDTYWLQGSWNQAKITMKEKLAITEHQTGKRSQYFLWDTFRLSEVLMHTKDYAEAHLHGRHALRGFKKLREPGYDGYEKSLDLLIKICKEQENLEDEEAYTALLGSHQAHMKTQQSMPTPEPSKTERTSVSDPQAEHGQRSHENVPQVSSPRSTMASDHRPDLVHSENDDLAVGIPATLGERKSVAEGVEQETITTDPNKLALAREERNPRSSSLTPIPTSTTSNGVQPIFRSSSPDTSPRISSSNSAQNHGFNQTSVTVANPFTTSEEAKPRSAPTYPSKTLYEHNDNEDTSYTKQLIDLCQQELGKKPVFMCGRGREGYNCIVLIDGDRNKELAKVTGLDTKAAARRAAAPKAYKALVSLITQAQRTNPAIVTLGELQKKIPKRDLQDPSSDKETYITPGEARMDPPAYTPNETPSNLSSPVDFLQSVPEIMVSPTQNDVTLARVLPNDLAQPASVRRAASDSRVPGQKNSTANHHSVIVKSSAENLRNSYGAVTDSYLVSHRRAASTSTRLPESYYHQHNRSPKQPSEPLPDGSSPGGKFERSKDHIRRPSVQPSVTFDSIESSVARPDHSNTDPAVALSPRSFSLLPTSLAKTFSLQDRRSKSEDPNLAKKKSLRFGLLSTSRRKSSTGGTPISEVANPSPASMSTPDCPMCNKSLRDITNDEAWSHVDNCLTGPTPQVASTPYELPASDPSSIVAELPAPFHPRAPSSGSFGGPTSPQSSTQSPKALSDLHRAFSRRDLSAAKFEATDEVGPALSPAIPQLEPLVLKSYQRQVLLLGDAQCGKTWLTSAWCNGAIPKTSLSTTTFTRDISGIEVVIQDRSGPDFVHDHVSRASYGVVHAVLLCFDISSADSFENIEHKWSNEADLYLNKIPKILVGCKKDINRGGSQTVWTHNAYKLTARINARAYFETSAVTMEGLDLLFNYVAQIAVR